MACGKDRSRFLSSYIHFTNDQKEQARQTDLCDLLQRQGEHLKKSGHEWQWHDGSDKVTIRGNLWYHQYEQAGGDAIDFVRRFYNKSYPEAVEFLLGNSIGTLIRSEPVRRKPPEPFVLPKKNHTISRVYTYLLKERKIDKEVLDVFIRKGMIYESADYHNAVFVGFDTDGVARHAHKRGSGSNSTYRGNAENCDPRYSFHWHGQQLEAAPNSHTQDNGILEHDRLRPSDRLYLFEAPIDMLSFISMQKAKDLQKVRPRECELRNTGIFERELAEAACRWRRHSYAACCGVSDQVMWQMMKDDPNIRSVFLCLDNDEGGIKAAERIKKRLKMNGILYDTMTPERKDWNEDLKHLPTEQEEERYIQTM